jgi:hemerythrin
MTPALWRDEYCTGDARIDNEHRALFGLVNDLHAAMANAASPAQMQAILTTMANHTIEHFQHEEALMVARNYPGYQRHKQVHDNLLAKVQTLLTRFNSDNSPLSADLTAFLTEWLSHHIQGEDQAMIRFLRSQPASEAIASDPLGGAV